MKPREDLYRDEDQRFFPLDDEERRRAAERAERAKAMLAGRSAAKSEERRPPRHLTPTRPAPAEEPGFYPSMEERAANFERLKKEIGAAVDAANGVRDGNG